MCRKSRENTQREVIELPGANWLDYQVRKPHGFHTLGLMRVFVTHRNPRVVASGLGLPEVVREPTPQENRAQQPAWLVGTDIYEIFSLSLRIFYAHPAMLRFPPLLS